MLTRDVSTLLQYLSYILRSGLVGLLLLYLLAFPFFFFFDTFDLMLTSLSRASRTFLHKICFTWNKEDPVND